MTRSSLVLGAAFTQTAGIGGLSWVFLQYLLGFRRLGWDVVLVDRVPASGGDGVPAPGRDAPGVAYTAEVMAAAGLEGCWSVHVEDSGEWIGLPKDEVLARARDGVLLNIMGYACEEDVVAAVDRRVFLGIDPGFPQMWRALGLHDPFEGHDDFVTIGENIGAATCPIPTCGLDWITTPQPVVLDWWPVADAPGEAFTTVASWRGPNGPVEYEGEAYGLRVHEFRPLIPVPTRAGATFRLALDIHEADRLDISALEAAGWELVDPGAVAADPWTYRQFVQHSAAEFMVAKQMYTKSRSGWLSDRTPVLPRVGPTRRGLRHGPDRALPDGGGPRRLRRSRRPCPGSPPSPATTGAMPRQRGTWPRSTQITGDILDDGRPSRTPPWTTWSASTRSR